MSIELCKAVLFDWGGTLACVRREDRVWADCARAATDVLASSGHRLPEQPALHLCAAFCEARARMTASTDHAEIHLPALLRSWLDGHDGDGAAPDTLERAADAFWQRWTGCLDVLGDAREVLRLLRQRGYVLGIVSNVSAPAQVCMVELRRLGLAEHLSTFTFSSTVGVRKPRQEMYDDALQRLRNHFSAQRLAANEILFVGDSPSCDVAGPSRLGMQTALLTHPDVVSPWPAQDYRNVDPTCRIRRLDALRTLLPGPAVDCAAPQSPK